MLHAPAIASAESATVGDFFIPGLAADASAASSKMPLNIPYSPSSWTPQDSSLANTAIHTEGVLALRGTLLAHNVAFEKYVSVRFTLDSWSTTSVVGAHYVGPHAAPSCSRTAVEPGPQWDRFAFHISLADYAGADRLSGRELVLAVQFNVPWVPEGGVAPYVFCGCYIRATRLTISGISSADSDRSGRVGRVGGPETFGMLGNPRSHWVITQ
ncbi:hypothetical protein DFH06DRAFT_1349621 [Mycena polygramma]|nr:hypothetical protein DFH06DRAFT_1349621 [Mycena polygramma]